MYVQTAEAENFRLTAAMVEAAITPKTKAIVINTPSNPSGAVMSAADLEGIVRMAHDRGIYLLLDECYVYLTFAGEPVSAGSFTDCKEHMIILGSLSKTYAMTGWRAGFCVRAAADHWGNEQAAIAVDVQYGEHGAAGVDCRGERLAGLRGRDEHGVQEAARPGTGGI